VGNLIILKIWDVILGVRVSPEHDWKDWTSACTVKKDILSNRSQIS